LHGSDFAIQIVGISDKSAVVSWHSVRKNMLANYTFFMVGYMYNDFIL